MHPCRYFLRARITRHDSSNITKVLDFAVQNIVPAPECMYICMYEYTHVCINYVCMSVKSRTKMVLSVKDCVHIEFEYDKSK